MKVIKHVVRWSWIDMSDPYSRTQHGQSNYFVALNPMSSRIAAKRLVSEIISNMRVWSDDHDIWVFNPRVVEITEEQV